MAKIGTFRGSRAVAALIAIAFLLRSMVPVGYMPDLQQSAGGLAFVLCLPDVSSASGGVITDYSQDQLAALSFLSETFGEQDQNLDKPCDFGLSLWSISVGALPPIPDFDRDAGFQRLDGLGVVGAAPAFANPHTRAPPVI